VNIWIAQAGKIIEKGEKWQEYGRIFTGEILKRKPLQKTTRQPAPSAEKNYR
jgi:hypothetical protein